MASGSLTDALRETLGLFDGSGVPLTTTEAAERLDLGRRSTYERLERLADRGELETKKAGASARIWWSPDPATPTDRRDRERRHSHERDPSEHRYRTLFQSIDQGYCIVEMIYDAEGDPVDYRFVETNPAFEEQTGLDDAVGKTMRELEPDHERHWFEIYGEVARTGEPVRFEAEAEALLGGWYNVYAFRFGEPDRRRVAILFEDVTGRKERERELEEYRRWNRTLIENIPAGAVALVDEELRYVTFGGTPEVDADLARSDLEGAHVGDVLPAEIADVVVPRYEDALNGEPSEFEDTIDGRVYQFHFVPVRDDDGEVFAATAMSRDVTGRKEREQNLQDAKSQLEAATEAGAVGTWEWRIPEDRLVAGASFARTFGVDPEAAREGVPMERFLSAVHNDDRERVERRIEEALATGGAYREEYRVRNAEGDLRWVVARGRVECDDDGAPVTFPGALVDITERKRAEQELEALNDLNEVVRDITDAVIDQSTREEIEDIVCERLARSASYRFAWIGEVDATSRTVELRTEAGIEGYLDDVTISVDPDDDRSLGPAGRAILSREVQVSRDVGGDSRNAPWLENVRAHEFDSIAAIPIVHEETLYGVLCVYADRPNAFSDDEEAVVGQLGEVVGHAIAAIERKHALISDEVVELEFQVPDYFEAFGLSVAVDGTVTFERTVPVGDGSFLEYGTATGDAMSAIHALAESEAVPHCASVNVLRDDAETTHFELKLIDPPLLTAVSAHGGYLDAARIEDGDYHVRIHLPPSTAVRRVIDPIAEVFPDVGLATQRQVNRDRTTETALRSGFFEHLTARQRAALEASYYAGYFAWPRDTKGEEIAESLGISAPTFHQHLRNAQRKLVGMALEDATPD